MIYQRISRGYTGYICNPYKNIQLWHFFQISDFRLYGKQIITVLQKPYEINTEIIALWHFVSCIWVEIASIARIEISTSVVLGFSYRVGL